MRGIREEYIVDSFVDFTGAERKFIIAAISTEVSDGYAETSDDDTEVEKALYLGISVCNIKDTFDEELGKRIAKSKALNQKSRVGALYASKKGVINTRVVRALLEQEAEYMKQNPGTYIKRYNKDKEMYLYYLSIADAYATMDQESRQAVDILRSKSPEEMWNLFKISAHLRKVSDTKE